MPYPQGQRQWPPYPQIPIFLETSDNNGTRRTFRTISPISPSPEIRPHDRPIQFLAVASTQFTNVSPVSPATQFTNLSPIWPIPEPPPEIIQHPPRRPALRFFPTAKPRIQLHAAPQPPQSEKAHKAHEDAPHPGRKSKLGLGILEDASNPNPTPTISPVLERTNRSSNIAQRIEEKIWRYNLSGNIIKRWLLEIISWFISAISMAIIIGVLIYYRNKKIPNWPGYLTLNAFISVLSKIAGAALILPVSEALGQLKWSWFQGHSKKMWDFEIFDNASRGPWGAFLLLIRTKGKTLAALGAVITIFSLALDPFFQQVVDFPTRWMIQGNSSIPRVVEYAPQFGKLLQGGFEILQKDQDIQAVAERFFYGNGTKPVIVGNATRPDIPLSCPTSNCTYPLYETLAVCSACVEVEQLLTYACLDTRIDWTSNLTGVGTESTYPNGTMCGYFLNATSEAPVLMSGYLVNSGNSSAGEALLTRALPLTTNVYRRPLFGGSINFKHVRNPISDVLIVAASNGSASVYRGEAPVAHECLLSWCSKTINSTYFWATYEEEVISNVTNTTEGPFPWTTTRVVLSPTLNGTKNVYSENITVDGSEARYGVSNLTHVQIITVFDDIFPSFTTVANSSVNESFLRFGTSDRTSVKLRSLEFNPWLPPNNLTRHMERLATAMTNVVRSSSSNEMVNGVAYNLESYVSVRWVWLILPLSLLFLSAGFLGATIAKTAKESGQLGVWKTSAIATLLYGLPDDMQRKITSAAEGGTPRARAKELKVKLLPKGWRVSGYNPFSPTTPKVPKSQPPPGWI